MAHLKLPKDLFINKAYQNLSLDAKVLYAFLADRASLSRKNGKHWEMKNGEYFVIFTQKETMERLQCGHDKATKLFHELERVGLIKRFPQGLGKAQRIVVDSSLLDT